MGRPRFAFDIASKLINIICDVPYPNTIDEHIIENFVINEIKKILEIDTLPKKNIEVLNIIHKNPGISAKEIANLSNISTTNMPSYISTLLNKNLITVIKDGRKKLHYSAGMKVSIFT